MVDIIKLKTLRNQTGISLAQCKDALEEAGGDIEAAKKILREKGEEVLKQRSSKEAGNGRVEAYIHPGGRMGVLLELRCQTDFVAKSDEFKKLAHELCLHIAASKPIFISAEEIPDEFIDGEKKIYEKQFAGSGKPEKIVEQIIEGKLMKYKKQVSLLSQPWVKDQNITIEELINDYIAKTGEKIVVGGFKRFEI